MGQMESKHRILFDCNPIVAQLIQKDKEIKVFHLMVKFLKEIETNSGTDISKDDQKWVKISKNLAISGLQAVKYTPDKCRQIFYECSKFYAQNYDYLNGNLDKKWQKIFDLLKIVHILDFKLYWSSYDWINCLLQQIAETIEIRDYLETRFPSKDTIHETKPKTFRVNEDSYLDEMSAKLVKQFEDIEAFNLIVQMMENFVAKTLPKKCVIKWETISQNMSAFGYSSEDYSEIKCREKFYEWTEFYAQNYDKLNGKLDNKSQEIFDLFKLVHILDLSSLWRSNDSILLILNLIFLSLDPFVAFNCVHKQMKQKTTQTNDTNSGFFENQNKDNTDKESEKEWKTIKMELKEIGKRRQNTGLNRRADSPEVVIGFDDMDLKWDLFLGIYSFGLEKPSPIQQRAIVPCIEGRDIIAQAQSGMGKTAAFVISILQMIDTCDEVQALILAPTRELAQQIHKTVLSLSKHMNIECILCIGGTPIREDKNQLMTDIHAVVGTVGRIYQLIKEKALRLDHLKILVLDESDQMLDLSKWMSELKKPRKQFKGFAQQIFEIIKLLDPKTQLFFSSATMPPEILKVSKWLMRCPVNILVKNEELTLEGIKQFYVQTITESMKLEMFCDLYHSLNKTQSFVYCNTRERVDKLTEQLQLKGIYVARIHGQMNQREREDILHKFRFGTYRVLLTSDLLGRGIDVQQVSLVVNYDLPTISENYIHRVGRSGRFGRKGIAITFITGKEIERLNDLQKFYSTSIEELPTDLSQII